MGFFLFLGFCSPLLNHPRHKVRRHHGVLSFLAALAKVAAVSFTVLHIVIAIVRFVLIPLRGGWSSILDKVYGVGEQAKEQLAKHNPCDTRLKAACDFVRDPRSNLSSLADKVYSASE